MNCPLCKNEIRESFVFCPICGRRLVNAECHERKQSIGRRVCAGLSLTAGILGILNVCSATLQFMLTIIFLLSEWGTEDIASLIFSLVILCGIVAFVHSIIAFACGLSGIVCGIIARKGVATVFGIILSIASVVGSCCLTVIGGILTLSVLLLVTFVSLAFTAFLFFLASVMAAAV